MTFAWPVPVDLARSEKRVKRRRRGRGHALESPQIKTFTLVIVNVDRPLGLRHVPRAHRRMIDGIEES